ncbi:MAG: type IV secretory system conjugative DNA transfer family protein, partial [Thermoguttaceae bacterium]|nr:type IV secretory system conjugative DNA transfer family protein [Thermoguttaceae bacterium]
VDRHMALVTSRDEFQVDMLFDEPTVVVLETFQADLRKTRPFVNMFFAQLFDSISRKAVRCAERKLPRPLSIFLDDFAASVGYIPECAQRLNMLRSMDARVVVALQSLAQLEQYYGPGEAHAIRCACGTKIYIPQLTVGDAKIASDESGETTVGESCGNGSDEKRSIGFARKDEPSKAQDANDESDPREYPRALLLDSDIRFPPEHPEYGPAATVFLPDRRPFQAWAPAAWQLPELKDFLKVDAREYSDDEALKKPQDYLAPWRNGSATSQSGSLTIDYNNMPQSAENAREEYEKIKKDYLDWPNTSGSAKKWWEAFERENSDRPQLIWRLCAELANRNATITEFFLTYIYSNTDNIQANLHYMDYSRLK